MWSNKKIISLLMSCSLIILLPACSSISDNQRLEITTALPTEELFVRAQQDLDQGKFEQAREKYSIITRRDIFNKLAKPSLLAEVELSYKLQMFEEASLAAKRYLSVYPGDADLDYMYYVIGSSVFAQLNNTDQDQSSTYEALDWFSALLKSFPNSSYAADAKAKIALGRNQLAGKEMEVGRYYQAKGSYIAAINRFNTVTNSFGDTDQVPEAMARLVETYLAMGLTPSAQKFVKLLGKNYPDSPWYGYAVSLSAS